MVWGRNAAEVGFKLGILKREKKCRVVESRVDKYMLFPCTGMIKGLTMLHFSKGDKKAVMGFWDCML